MSGLQLVQILPQQRAEMLRSVAALSADLIALQQVLATDVGHVLAKPFDLETVLALVASITASFPADSNPAHERE